jgi:gamma-glutamylcyclotransferase (GGCT)/AIG2-like uncharacterized protein YtfP
LLSVKEPTTPANWWASESIGELAGVVSHMNDANTSSDDVEFCRDAFSALNLLWTQLYRFQRRNTQLRPEHVEKGRGDTASFEELLRVTLALEDKLHLLESNDMQRFVALTPRVMSHDILRREDYDPSLIADDLRKKASEKHSELASAYEKWRRQKNPDSLEKTVKRLADLLFVIRSNIAHGEKTSRGPDVEKVRRDQQVCRLARPVLTAMIGAIFDHPDRRLAAYGTLRPGEPNNSKLAKFHGIWRDGRVHGAVILKDELPYFDWDLSATEISVKIFESVELETNWSYLDSFEGPSYRRIWVVTSFDGTSRAIANIYALDRDRSG